MIEYLSDINDIPIYTDPYMEDNKVIKGKKGNFLDYTFIIANPKTAKLIRDTLIKKDRKEKLNKIDGIS